MTVEITTNRYADRSTVVTIGGQLSAVTVAGLRTAAESGRGLAVSGAPMDVFV